MHSIDVGCLEEGVVRGLACLECYLNTRHCGSCSFPSNGVEKIHLVLNRITVVAEATKFRLAHLAAREITQITPCSIPTRPQSLTQSDLTSYFLSTYYAFCVHL